MRGYKNFEGTPHPGDLCHLVEIGYTENMINENGYHRRAARFHSYPQCSKIPQRRQVHHHRRKAF